MQDIAAHVSDDVFRKHLAARERVLEARLAAEFAQQQAELKRRMEEQAASRIAPVRNLIIDKVLTLACPRCGMAFVDFTGCLALTCSRDTCKAAFCGVCLHDGGTDAHAHVRSCEFTNRDLFASQGQVPVLQNKWRTGRIRHILLDLSPELKRDVLASLANELRDVGLDAQAVA